MTDFHNIDLRDIEAVVGTLEYLQSHFMWRWQSVQILHAPIRWRPGVLTSCQNQGGSIYAFGFTAPWVEYYGGTKGAYSQVVRGGLLDYEQNCIGTA